MRTWEKIIHKVSSASSHEPQALKCATLTTCLTIDAVYILACEDRTLSGSVRPSRHNIEVREREPIARGRGRAVQLCDDASVIAIGRALEVIERDIVVR